MRYADLLLHVIDISNPEWELQAEIVDDLVRSLGAEGTPCLRVFNKCDRYLGILPHGDDVVCVSAKTGEGTDALLSKISDLLTGRMTEYELLIPYGDAAVLDPLRHEAEMLSLEYREDGIYVRAVLDERMLGRMKQYIPGYVEPLEEWER